MRSITNFLELTPDGLYCEPGGFHIDPWRPVERAVVTHAHSDHARRGCGRYLTSTAGEWLLRARVGSSSQLTTLEYGESLALGNVHLSLHPAGHVLGSCQIRLECGGHVCIVSGDYKRQTDRTCAPYETLRCHTLVSESTFGLPIYRWPSVDEVIADMMQWWRRNQQNGLTSILFVYALGKAQRVLAELDPDAGPLVAHGAIWQMNRMYERSGVTLPIVRRVDELAKNFDWSQALILAPPSAIGSPWLKRFGKISMAQASGWMTIRGVRRRRSVDRGFVLSDHVDWPGLLQTVRESECERCYVTHGYSTIVARYLTEQGLEAQSLESSRDENAGDD